MTSLSSRVSTRELWGSCGYEAEMRLRSGRWDVTLRHVERGLLFSDWFESRAQAWLMFEDLAKGIRAGFYREIDLP